MNERFLFQFNESNVMIKRFHVKLLVKKDGLCSLIRARHTVRLAKVVLAESYSHVVGRFTIGARNVQIRN